MSSPGPDAGAFERVFEAFLRASGAPLDDPELAETPRRAAEAWAGEFLDGYQTAPAEALGRPSAAPKESGIVLVTALDYVGVCPHHLLPYRGLAHVGYLPAGKVAGFGRVPRLVDALAHRLTLQETLAVQIAQALWQGLSAAGAAVILEAEQTCLSMRGEHQTHSRTVTEGQAGETGEAVLARLRRAVALPVSHARTPPRSSRSTKRRSS